MRVCILHRFPAERIVETNASFPFLLELSNATVKTFRKFNRLNPKIKFIKSIWWCLTAWTRTVGRGYDVIYCDDSFPFYPILVKLTSPRSKVVLRLGDFHLMYHCSGGLYDFLHRIELIGWYIADMIIAISPTMVAKILSEVQNTPTCFIEDPVDPLFFRQIKLYKNIRPVVMFHGTITANKGLMKLMRCATLMPQYDFKIVGDGEYLPKLQALNLPNVQFLGWIPYKEIIPLLCTADVGVAMRSKNRGNEYVVTSPWVQYIASGVPCVVSRRRVFTDIGFPCQFDTVDELHERIENILASPQTSYWRDYVKEHHNARGVAERIWKLLLSC